MRQKNQHGWRMLQLLLLQTGVSFAEKSEPEPSVGFHYMLCLPTGSDWEKDKLDGLLDIVLSLDTCFTEILVTLDYGNDKKVEGDITRLLAESEGAAGFLCAAKDLVGRTAQKLEARCGANHSVTTNVRALDPMYDDVKDALFQVFNLSQAPPTMFKNVLAYMYAPLVMSTTYIMHVDDDFRVAYRGEIDETTGLFASLEALELGEIPPSRTTFIGQSILVMQQQQEVYATDMMCCSGIEKGVVAQLCTPDLLIRLPWSGTPEVGGVYGGRVPFAHLFAGKTYEEPGAWTCGYTDNLFSLQAYLMHAARFRSMFPLSREGFEKPERLQTECLLEGAAELRTPERAIFAWLPHNGTGQCKLQTDQVRRNHDLDMYGSDTTECIATTRSAHKSILAKISARKRMKDMPLRCLHHLGCSLSAYPRV